MQRLSIGLVTNTGRWLYATCYDEAQHKLHASEGLVLVLADRAVVCADAATWARCLADSPQRCDPYALSTQFLAGGVPAGSPPRGDYG